MSLTAIGAEPVARVESLHFGQRVVGNGSRPVRHAIDDRVVNQDRHAVAGQVHIALQNRSARRQGQLEGAERVLRGLTRATPMSDGDRGSKIEVRMGHGG